MHFEVSKFVIPFVDPIIFHLIYMDMHVHVPAVEILLLESLSFQLIISCPYEYSILKRILAVPNGAAF